MKMRLQQLFGLLGLTLWGATCLGLGCSRAAGEIEADLGALDLGRAPDFSGADQGRSFQDASVRDRGSPPDATGAGHDAGAVDAGSTRRFVSLGAGRDHTCGVDEQSTVHCWGLNASGQLGDGSTIDRPSPAPVGGLADVTRVVLGAEHSCALQREGWLSCWGQNQAGQLGADGDKSSSVPVRVGGQYTAVAAMRLGTCAISKAGQVMCWGHNERGQLGDGTTTLRRSPVPVSFLSNAGDIECGHETCCALAYHAQHGAGVYCWGTNAGAQLGDGGALQMSSVPVKVALPHAQPAVRIAAANGTVCALHQDGRVSCWGRNAQHEIPGGAAGPARPPALTNLESVSWIEAGYAHFCARRPDGLYCWGENEQSQLGTGDGLEQAVPVLALAGDVTGAALGLDFSCAVHLDHQVHCWGANRFGQLGTGATDVIALDEAPIEGFSEPVAEIGAGHAHTCARTSSGRVYCWGGNDRGQLGAGDTTHRGIPWAVTLPDVAIGLAIGDRHSCAVLRDRRMFCWGEGSSGRLGNGTAEGSKVPTAVSGLNDAVEGACAEGGCCARRAGGTVSCWGFGGSGALGDGSTRSSNVPVPVRDISDALRIAGAGTSFCALREGGVLACWGQNTNGQLGNGTRANALVPTKVALNVSVEEIVGGSRHFCARTSSEVYCWGLNVNGQRGDGTITLAALPAAVTLPGAPTMVAAGAAHSCAVVGDEQQLHCWGMNSEGQLGLAPRQDVTTQPVLVEAMKKRPQQLAGGLRHGCALYDGAVTCWGSNAFGQLGRRTIGGTLVPTPLR